MIRDRREDKGTFRNRLGKRTRMPPAVKKVDEWVRAKCPFCGHRNTLVYGRAICRCHAKLRLIRYDSQLRAIRRHT